MMESAGRILRRSRRKNRIRDIGVGDWVFVVIVYSLLAVFFFLVLYPMIFVVSASLSDPMETASGKVILWPVGFTLDGYGYILRYKDLWVGYANTIYYTVLGTALNVAVTLTCAYALSRKDLVGRGLIMTILIIPLYFSGGLIPTYLNYLSFNLVNKRAIMLIDGLVWTINIIVSRAFFATTIPWELQESAKIDGCGDFKTFLRIVLPLSMPIVIVMTLFYGVGHWNSYFSAMIYLQDRKIFPLQLFLREILVQSQLSSGTFGLALSAEELAAILKQANMANLLKYALIVVSTAPMMILYPWMQRFFAKGVMIGSLKG